MVTWARVEMTHILKQSRKRRALHCHPKESPQRVGMSFKKTSTNQVSCHPTRLAVMERQKVSKMFHPSLTTQMKYLLDEDETINRLAVLVLWLRRSGLGGGRMR